MATVSLTYPDANEAEVLATLEQSTKNAAIGLVGSENDYNALTARNRIKANLVAYVRAAVRRERVRQAEAAAGAGVTEADVT